MAKGYPEITMERMNLSAAWIAIFLGLVTGVMQGFFFHDEKWLGGYGSWKRRMLRLGHVSFFGIAFLNLAFVVSVAQLHLSSSSIVWPSQLLIAGQITMPLVCFMSAYKKQFRHLFFIPVLSLLIGTAMFISQWMFK